MALANRLRRSSLLKVYDNRDSRSSTLANLPMALMGVSFGSLPLAGAYLQSRNWTCFTKTGMNTWRPLFARLSRRGTLLFLIATTSRPWPIRESEASILRKSAGPMRSSRHALTSFSFLNYHWILQWPELGSAMGGEINLSEENLSNSAGRYFTP